MKAWSNIQIPPQDPEIVKINNFEKNLGELPDGVYQVRELITRFEVCHFKYQQHLRKIIDSIMTLQPLTDPAKIGVNHIKNGEIAWRNDKTGRSIIGHRYLSAIKKWLEHIPIAAISDTYNQELGQQIESWLGDKNPEKERMVRLLLARMTWDWKSFEELQRGGEYKDLEFQVCRMDICHYAFPANLDLLLHGIGEMMSVKEFEGCGSVNENIKAYAEKEFSNLNDLLISLIDSGKSSKNELIKAWLVACLAKTLKEQVNLSNPIVELVN